MCVHALPETYGNIHVISAADGMPSALLMAFSVALTSKLLEGDSEQVGDRYIVSSCSSSAYNHGVTF